MLIMPAGFHFYNIKPDVKETPDKRTLD